jgi:hypothetical protein
MRHGAHGAGKKTIHNQEVQMKIHNGVQALAAVIPAVVEEVKPTELKPQSCAPQSQAVTLHSDSQGKQELATMLYQCFQGLKVWGKDPDSLEGAVALFQMTLAGYPMEKIRKGFKIHLSRSGEMPTPADIVGLIKRNGKPPLSQAMYIAISKKDGEDRTDADWQYIREYEADQREGFSEMSDPVKDEATAIENSRLRKELMYLCDEVKRLADLLHAERKRNGLEKAKPTLQAKIDATIEAMREGGASEADIDEFRKGQAA